VEKFIDNNFKVNPFKFIHSETSFFNKDRRIREVMNRYNLIKNKTIHITDEERDVASCKRIGIKCVAVTWGFESKVILKRSKPDYIIDKPSELAKRISDSRGFLSLFATAIVGLGIGVFALVVWAVLG
jgi:phosphoglycolate phosphatase